MKIVRNFLDTIGPTFEKGGKFEKLYPVYEMIDTFIYTPGEISSGDTHIRDAIDLKRIMSIVALALVPCLFMACYNTGFQANSVISSMDSFSGGGWRIQILKFLGLEFDPSSLLSNFTLGLLYFLPVFLVTNIVGGFWETVFAVVRKHEINEGFLVTGLLFPLILPPTIPLWQVALGISFGVIFGKEVFGGTGKNFLNPALTSRAFLFFAYPAEISGDAVWIAVDGHTGATALAQAAAAGVEGIAFTWLDAFWGLIPGSMGETSTFACLIGAFVLIVTGIGSWKIMLSMTLTTGCLTFLLNCLGSSSNLLFALSPCWHYVLGGYAFACVYMATDPVTSSQTQLGQWFYGALIGFMGVLVRVLNPAFPEGWMLAILFSNLFAPLIDYFVIQVNIKRRMARNVN